MDVPDGYTQEDFQSHRSAYILTYFIYGFEPLSMNKINLGLAETWEPNCVVGNRVLDFTVNGIGLAFGVDVFAEAGCNTAHIVSGDIPADMNGAYELHVGASDGDSMLSTISIEPAVAPEFRSELLINSKYPNDGSVYDILGETNIFGTSQQIANLGAFSRALFKDQRSAQAFSYIAKGFEPLSTKLVTLGFAEYYEPNCFPGKRIFDAVVNGIVFADDLDVFVAAGNACLSGYTITLPIQVDSNGEIDLSFESSVEKAMISFIKIDETNEPPVEPGPSRAEIEQALVDARLDIESILTPSLAAKFLRLSFHDCVGGICDGCVDTSNPSNFGLDIPIDALAPIAVEYDGVLTRADIWILAAMVAVQETQNPNTPVLPFQMEWVGRPVCEGPANRGPDRTLPSAHMVNSDLLEFFNTEFGFTDRDTVAIIGAHTLGRALPRNSGFNGRNGWVGNPDRFNNKFYIDLFNNGQIDTTFGQQLQNNGARPDFPDQFLWRLENSNRFMLNVDMGLAVDFQGFIDPVSGEVTCELTGSANVCPQATTLDIALEFVASNDDWVDAFHTAFMKMSSIGCSASNCVELLE